MSNLKEPQYLLENLIQQEDFINSFVKILQNAKSYGNRIWLAGNGGSASISSHFMADLLALGFDAFCMNDNISRITAITNDFSWELAYVEQLSNFKAYDVLILISVHGGGNETENWSQNLLLAAIEARKKGGKILSLVGSNGGRLKELSDIYILVPSENSGYVEGLHSLLTHIICERLKEVPE